MQQFCILHFKSSRRDRSSEVLMLYREPARNSPRLRDLGGWRFGYSGFVQVGFSKVFRGLGVVPVVPTLHDSCWLNPLSRTPSAVTAPIAHHRPWTGRSGQAPLQGHWRGGAWAERYWIQPLPYRGEEFQAGAIGRAPIGIGGEATLSRFLNESPQLLRAA